MVYRQNPSEGSGGEGSGGEGSGGEGSGGYSGGEGSGGEGSGGYSGGEGSGGEGSGGYSGGDGNQGGAAEGYDPGDDPFSEWVYVIAPKESAPDNDSKIPEYDPYGVSFNPDGTVGYGGQQSKTVGYGGQQSKPWEDPAASVGAHLAVAGIALDLIAELVAPASWTFVGPVLMTGTIGLDVGHVFGELTGLIEPQKPKK
jgi:hypothetical protein